MTRLAINPEEARRAGLGAVAAADDVAQTGAAVQGFAVPQMPAELAAKYAGALDGVGARCRRIATTLAQIGEELQVRAAAAELADGGRGGRLAAQRLALALGRSTVTGMAGAAVTVTATVGRRRELTVRTASGTTLVLGTRDHDSRPRHGTDPRGGGVADGRRAEPPPPSAEAVTSEPLGGTAGAHVYEAAGAGEPLDEATIGAAGERSEAPQGSELRAVETGADAGGVLPAADPPPPESTDRQRWACWMAARAAREGLPPALPLMESLAASGLRNLPAAGDRIGLFARDPGAAYAPAGHGMPRDAHPDTDWWRENPAAQLDDAVRRLQTAGGGGRGAELDDPDALARWIADAGGTSSPEDYAAAHESAAALVDTCGESAAAGGGVVATAAGQLGVSEAGANSGPEVDMYLAAAGAGGGNPWCAGFVTWVLEQNGQAMTGEGWAAVATWVDAAGAGEHGLSLVAAEHARPGDVVAFDWGGGGDYGADGHIGFLDSPVRDGGFTTIEGNSGDAVSRQERGLERGSPVFIRVGAS